MSVHSIWKAFWKTGPAGCEFSASLSCSIYLLLLVAIVYDACEAKFVRYRLLLAAAGCLIMIIGSLLRHVCRLDLDSGNWGNWCKTMLRVSRAVILFPLPYSLPCCFQNRFIKSRFGAALSWNGRLSLPCRCFDRHVIFYC